MNGIVSTLCAFALVGGVLIGEAAAGGGDKAKTSGESAGTTASEQTQTIEGVVQSVSGDSLTVTTDDGDTKVVDASQVSQNVMQVVAVGENVTIVGVQTAGTFKARDVKKADRASRGDRTDSPSASPRTGNGRQPSGQTSERPTSAEDCKDGGYARYGFSNQGQCVSAVAPGRQQ
jgi:hypothetical protein